MINFIREKDILPTENLLKLLNIIINYDNKGVQEHGFLDREEEDSNFTLNINFKYNRCRCGFKNKDYFISKTLKFNANENVILNCEKCKKLVDNTIFNIKIDYNQQISDYECEIFSIRKILKTSKEMLQDYLRHFNLNKLDLELLKKLILNLILYSDNFYFKNIQGSLLKSFKAICSKLKEKL